MTGPTLLNARSWFHSRDTERIFGLLFISKHEAFRTIEQRTSISETYLQSDQLCQKFDALAAV